LPAVLYGYETGSLTLSEEYKSQVYENKVFWKVFGLREGEECQ